MQRLAIAIAVSLALLTPASAEQQPAPRSDAAPIRLAQAASSCSGWKSICESRGPGCDAKYSKCLKSGCWTEGPAYGGKTHCGLAKK